MPVDYDDEMEVGEENVQGEEPTKPPMVNKKPGMQAMIGLLGKMRALMQAIAESKDMAMMPQVMSMMDELQSMMAKMHGGSHYQKT